MKTVLAIAFCFVAGLANAQEVGLDLPSLFSVSGVASDDTLNIRSEPNASAAIIGELAHDETRVEVVARSSNGRWGLVNTDEQSGWASLRFLEEQPFQQFPPSAFSCFGTEPFWYSDTIGSMTEWSAIGEDPVTIPTGWVGGSMMQDRFGLRALGPSTALTMVVRKSLCSDGMSDRLYGLEVDLVVDGFDTQFYSGCCSLSN